MRTVDHKRHDDDSDRNIKCAQILKNLLKREELESYQNTDCFKEVEKMIGHAAKGRGGIYDLRVSEVAKKLRVSESFVRSLCDSGQLPFYKVGQERRVKGKDVEVYLESRKLKTQEFLDDLANDAQDMDLR